MEKKYTNRSSKGSRRKDCVYGVKKSGGCKKKPGPKKTSRKVARRSPARASRRRVARKSRRGSESMGKHYFIVDGRVCKYGVKKSGECKEKPGRKSKK